MSPGTSELQERAGGGEEYCQRRDDFLEALRELCAGLDDRRRQLEVALGESASRSEGARRVYDHVWSSRLRDFSKRVESLRGLALVRPTVCLMGKRGAGKTTLIQHWLGNAEQGGIEELRYFPTGGQDTTAALVRLTPMGPRSPWDPDCLHLSLLGAEDLPEVRDDRPPHPLGERDSLRLSKRMDEELADRVLGPQSAPGSRRRGREIPYNVCRFPNNEKDRHFSLKNAGQHYEIADQYDGIMPLTSVQWHTWQVVAPVQLPKGSRSWAERVLSVVDVVDAPGADSQTQGAFPEWKRHKNRYVFERGIKELDVLLLVASSEIAAVQLGGQFQADIWGKWVDRCGAEGKGRLFLVFSRASEFIKGAANALEGESGSSSNEDLDAANTIWRNVIEPLAAKISGRPSLVQSNQLESWPPFFFYDKDPKVLEGYSGGIGPGQGAEVAKRLVAWLDDPDRTPGEIPPDLPLGQRCILRMALDWENWGRSSGHWADIRAVQAWTIRAFCALFDPEDRGFALLTETLERYTVGGPVARNHAGERRRAVESAFEEFRDLLSAMEVPQENALALQDLQLTQGLVREWRSNGWRGVNLNRGTRCARRAELVRANSSPLQQQKVLFHVEDVIRDVVEDCIDRLGKSPRAMEESEVRALKNVFSQCVLRDGAVGKIFLEEEDAVNTREDVLGRWQAIILERLARVVVFLADADENSLRDAARYCFDVDMDAEDLLGDVRRGGLLAVEEKDLALLKKVQSSFNALEKSMDAVRFEHPFASRKSPERQGLSDVAPCGGQAQEKEGRA